eukprot:CAMPEP_0173429138 /NCGR_PEP_ID=MMETSP1357-20121228/7926_1 /TAXON_ID=77926 /ORGANISM="Hemiselmis rufescens, Strain PCC563" /LENGTH=1106 /DNA_ID=CAMNT_0014393271 /DNA_START=100 /DNA_END=3420 /DNA_ORIENTATION=-
MADGESVRVAVRVRPFNQREKDRSSKLCIRMMDKTTTIRNPENDVEKPFTFDFSYWSHDGAKELPNGYNEPAGPGAGTDGATYADQDAVFQDLGQGVLNNAYEGFNSCLFAYGQTGSGKSYSMVGYGTNKGIVPVSCDAIFKKIDEMKAGPDGGKFQYQVTIQMLEIYNEQVRDLFAKANPSGGLKVRMNPKSGVEVVGLSEWPVGSYKEIDERIETATKNRTVAATQMNATSSRAHTVVTIAYTQLELNAKGPGKHSEKKAKINLVDLAGSERAESTGATGDRLKEGAAINLSLTMLGNVITALAEKSNNPNKKVLVPYRDSKLTCILQDALGGNAKTIMICALSPADINYEETLSTLRYADRAKQIKNKPKVNLDPTEVLIQQLKEENERLKKMGGGGGGGADEEEVRRQMEKEIQDKLEQMNKGWEEKLKEAQERAAAEDGGGGNENKRKETEAHILNVHEDPVLSKAIVYFFPPGKETAFGNRNSAGGEDILLGGLSIRPDHCRVKNEDGKLSLTVREQCKVLVNGQEMPAGTTELNHNDRLSLGTNYFFVVVNPPQASSPPDGGWPEVDWDFLNREIAKAQGLSVDVNWSAMTEEEKRRALLNDELVQVMPRVTEANALSLEMKRGIAFETKITPVMTKHQGMISQVMVKVRKTDTGIEWLWDKVKFINRVYIMREHYEKMTEGTLDLSTMAQEEDPFWDPNDFMNMGYSTVFLKPIAYCMNIEDDYSIYHETQQDGVVRIKIEPCRPDGTKISEEDEGPYDDIEDPKDLIGKRLDLLVNIQYARGLNSKYSKEVYCEFEMFKAPNPQHEEGRFQTATMSGTTNPNFNYSQQVTWMSVDADVVQTLETGSVYFHMWGLQDDQSGGSAPPKRKLLSAQEAEAIQQDLKKKDEALEREKQRLYSLYDQCVVGAQGNEATSGLLCSIADTLADAGVDVTRLLELANAVKPMGGGGEDGDKLKAEVDKLTGEKGGLEEKVASLEKQVEEARKIASSDDNQLSKDLASAQEALGKKDAELLSVKEELKAKDKEFEAKEQGWQKKLEAANSTPTGSAPDDEVKKLKDQVTKLEGERDSARADAALAKAEAAKAGQAQAGCSQACVIS